VKTSEMASWTWRRDVVTVVTQCQMWYIRHLTSCSHVASCLLKLSIVKEPPSVLPLPFGVIFLTRSSTVMLSSPFCFIISEIKWYTKLFITLKSCSQPHFVGTASFIAILRGRVVRYGRHSYVYERHRYDRRRRMKTWKLQISCKPFNHR